MRERSHETEARDDGSGGMSGGSEREAPPPFRRAGQPERPGTRRRFLGGGMMAAAAAGWGAMFVACGDVSPLLPSSSATPVATIGADLDIARLWAGIEATAVTMYEAAIAAVASGALGKAPGAVVAFAAAARQQHADHGRAWNDVLTKHGQRAQTDPDPALLSTVQSAVKGLTTLPQFAGLALSLEDTALQTYVNSVTAVQDGEARRIALTIAPVEAQHAAVLNYLLGQFPVPDTVIPRGSARGIDDLHLPVATASPG